MVELMKYVVVLSYGVSVFCFFWSFFLLVTLKRFLKPSVSKPTPFLNYFWYVTMPRSCYVDLGIMRRNRALKLLGWWVRFGVLGLLVGLLMVIVAEYS
jgi:hypothetical protein